jgi:uncharacterized protein YeeX (DUF496 family)
MQSKDFARLLISELVDKKPSKSDPRVFHRRNGIDPERLDDADQIWLIFVRYNLDTKGMKSTVVEKRWLQIPKDSLLKNRNRLLEKVVFLKNENAFCCKNFTTNCPITYTQQRGFSKNCLYPKFFNSCPVSILTKELQWHRAHYQTAKIIVECAKRLLIEDTNGSKEANLNHVVEEIFDRYRDSGEKWKKKATNEFLSKFDGIYGYGKPPKVVVWLLSDLSSPVHHVNHWGEIDTSQLIPIDTHVGRLALRFRFVGAGNVSNNQIRNSLSQLYPEEPRKLDFALYRLGSEMEENICSKTPNCLLCSTRFPKIYEVCPAKTGKETIVKAEPDITEWMGNNSSSSIAPIVYNVESISKNSEWIQNAQSNLVETYVEFFNNKINTNQENGYGKIREQFEYFQTVLLGIIRKYLLLNLSEKNLKVEIGNVEKSYSSRLSHIIVKRTDLPNERSVLAVIKVSSWGDLSGYKRFRSVLQSRDLVEKGFYLAINGAMRDVVDGENQNLFPKVFFFSRILGAIVSAKIKIPSDFKINVGVLEHFLEALKKRIISKDNIF